MADFRKYLPALALSALVAIASMPAAAQVTCTTNASGTPLIRSEGRTELLGELVLNCTAPVASPGVTATVLRVRLSVPVTSPYTGTMPTATSTAQLLINNDVPSARLARQTDMYTLEWTNVPVMAIGSTASILRIVNVRGDATVVPISPSISSYVTANLSADPPGVLTFNTGNPYQTVAQVAKSLSSTVSGSLSYRQCLSAPEPSGTPSSSGTISLSFTELFSTAFKPAQDAAREGGDSVIGAAYSDESGFVNSAVAVGPADSGTAFRATFQNIPAGATVWVSNRTSVPVEGDPVGITATLNNASLEDVTDGWTALTATGSTATADYYVVDAPVSTFADYNTVTVYAVISYSADPANNIPSITGPGMTVSLSYGPGLANSRVPYALPSFSTTATNTSGSLISINPCVTNLLFPYVVSDGANFDTGVAIANTSNDGADGDVFATHTSGQTGNCKIWFFGTGAPSGPQTTPTIAAGSVYGFSLYSGDSTNGASIAPIAALTRGGYAIAKCNFQFAHGYAFIQNVGLPTKFAQSYLALVIPDRGTSRLAQDASTAGGDAGEMLAQ
jgi:hypothetical protein